MDSIVTSTLVFILSIKLLSYGMRPKILSKIIDGFQTICTIKEHSSSHFFSVHALFMDTNHRQDALMALVALLAAKGPV